MAGDELNAIESESLARLLSACRPSLTDLARWLDRNGKQGTAAIPLETSRLAVILTAEQHARLVASGLL